MTLESPRRLSNGVDLVSVSRIRDLIERFGGSFVDRIYTRGEAEYCRGRPDPAQHFAARWAAKEATVKALPGGRTVVPRDVHVDRTDDGPALELRDTAAAALDGRGNSETSVSISHDRTLDAAIAHVTIVTDHSRGEAP